MVNRESECKRVTLIRKEIPYEGKYFSTYKEQLDGAVYIIEEYSNEYSSQKIYRSKGYVNISNNKVVGWWKDPDETWEED